MKRRSRSFLIILLMFGIIVAIGAGIWLHLSKHQQQKPLMGQWVHLPRSKPGQPTPTAPANGYLFKDATGGFVVYHLPTIPPASFTWMTYRNQQDGYVIDYPSNWIRVKTVANGHTELAFYPPGTDLKENVPGGPQGISITWTSTYQPAVLTDNTITDIKRITINGRTGQLYTQGSLGSAIIVTFPLRGEGFVVTADATSDMLIYVFQHMLASLKFT